MVSELKKRPRPRSPSFTMPVAVMNTLAGLMSAGEGQGLVWDQRWGWLGRGRTEEEAWGWVEGRALQAMGAQPPVLLPQGEAPALPLPSCGP